MPRRRRSATSTKKRSRSSVRRKKAPRARRNDEASGDRRGGGVRARRWLRWRESSGFARVDVGAGQEREGPDRSGPADQALRTVYLQRLRPARPLQAAQDRDREG